MTTVYINEEIYEFPGLKLNKCLSYHIAAYRDWKSLKKSINITFIEIGL